MHAALWLSRAQLPRARLLGCSTVALLLFGVRSLRTEQVEPHSPSQRLFLGSLQPSPTASAPTGYHLPLRLTLAPLQGPSSRASLHSVHLILSPSSTSAPAALGVKNLAWSPRNLHFLHRLLSSSSLESHFSPAKPGPLRPLQPPAMPRPSRHSPAPVPYSTVSSRKAATAWR